MSDGKADDAGASSAGSAPEVDQARAQAELARAELELTRLDLRAVRAELSETRTELERWRADADALRERAERLQQRLDKATGSISFALGRMIVRTARSPQTVPQVPGDLVRLWRRRRSRGQSQATDPARPAAAVPAGAAPEAPGTATRAAGARPSPSSPAAGPRANAPASRLAPPTPPGAAAPRAPAAAAPAGPRGSADDELRFIAHTAFASSPRTRPAIAAIATLPTAASLAVDAIVTPVGPNDARLIVERTRPDILFVESAALGPAQAWAFTTDPAGVERTAALTDLVDLVHAQGGAAVLVRNRHSIAAAGLVPLESRFDLVLEAEANPTGEVGWTRGVQLAIFNPLGAPAARDPRPLFLGPISPRDPYPQRRLTERALAAMTEHRLELCLDADSPDDTTIAVASTGGTGMRVSSWRERPDLLRNRLVALANPFSTTDRALSVDPRILELLACGTRVISGPDTALLAAVADAVTFTPSAEHVEAAYLALCDRGAPTELELLRLLRVLFEHHATPVTLSRITRRLWSLPDPTAGRSTSVVLSDPASGGLDSLVDGLLEQSHRPAEVIVVDGGTSGWREGAAGALDAAGIDVRVIRADDRPVTWGAVSEAVRSEWLLRWPSARPGDRSFLMDLAIGAEMSRADAVGFEEGGAFRYVPSLPLDGTLVRTSVARAVLGQRHLTGDEGRLDGWQQRGLRMLSLGRETNA